MRAAEFDDARQDGTATVRITGVVTGLAQRAASMRIRGRGRGETALGVAAATVVTPVVGTLAPSLPVVLGPDAASLVPGRATPTPPTTPARDDTVAPARRWVPHLRHQWLVTSGDDGRHPWRVCTTCGRRKGLATPPEGDRWSHHEHSLRSFRL